MTENAFGKGKAYYIGTQPDMPLLSAIVDRLQLSPLAEASDGMEITQRFDEKSEVLFALNHAQSEGYVDLGPGTYTELLTGRKATGKTAVQPNDVGVFAAERRKQ